MRAVMSILASLIRRWRYVEEEAPTPSSTTGSTAPVGELQRLRASLAHEEQKLADYHRYGLDSLAGHSNASIRSLKSRILALEGDLGRKG